MIPANSTDLLQPMDLSVNKCVKDYLHKQFQEWYAEEILIQTTSESEIVPVALCLSTLPTVCFVGDLIYSLSTSLQNT